MPIPTLDECRHVIGRRAAGAVTAHHPIQVDIAHYRVIRVSVHDVQDFIAVKSQVGKRRAATVRGEVAGLALRGRQALN